MDFLVFGDDYDRHPSTTQHLVRALPSSDRVVWVDSLGLRAPSLSAADAGRILARLGKLMRPSAASESPRPANLRVVSPCVLPFHDHRLPRALNRTSLTVQVRSALAELGIAQPHVVVSNPSGALYADIVERASLTYLRLDDHALLPGVDANLVRACEARLFAEADIGFATATKLLPEGAARRRFHYLPQGVNLAHFGRARPSAGGAPVLGFFGILAEWLDWALIERVARLSPTLTLEFAGAQVAVPPSVRALKNVRLLGPVSYAALPELISHWTCAWIPFLVNDLTRAVNPLKVREYLAAGLACASTALPEVLSLDQVEIVHDERDVLAFCLRAQSNDTAAARAARRTSVAEDGWDNRANTLRYVLARNLKGHCTREPAGDLSCTTH